MTRDQMSQGSTKFSRSKEQEAFFLLGGIEV
jgi:hypothetical protein